ncbi:MAG: site-2 protease family protein [Acidobacteriota bacterium]
MSDLDAMLTPGLVARVWSDPVLRGLGLKIALPTLFILLCHEFGHYIACRRYRVQATLPYFLPAPFGFGSLGAFIRIKSPLRSFRELFDVGFSGPAAGFVALLPWLFYGLAHSTPVPLTGAAPHASVAGLESALLVPGRCLAIQLAALPFHGWLPSNVALNLHPFALAAWIGLFATALNLLPLGQLDGGHILYAAIGRRQHRLAWPLWAVLAGLAFYWPGWGLWCGLLLFMGVKHPAVWDESQPLDSRRRWLALSALVLFVLCFMPVPLRTVPLP